MATAWDLLLAGSELVSGNAWDHLSNLRTGATTQYVLDGVFVYLEYDMIDVQIDDTDIQACLDDAEILVQLDDAPVATFSERT